MVKYNGIALESLSAALHVIDVSISAPGVENTTITPALRPGDIFARSRVKPRSVIVTFVVMTDSMTERRRIIRDVVEWAYKGEPMKLELPQEPDGYLMAVCSGLPDNAAREYWETLSVSFVADDPFFQANEVSSVELQNGAAVNVRRSDAPDWWIIQDASAEVGAPMWGVGSQQISFISLPAGRIEIRRDKQTADVDGNSALPAMMLGSRFFDLKRGTNIFSLSGGAGGTINWRERWI